LSTDDLPSGVLISPEVREKLIVYADLLVKWQKQINLISASTVADLWRRHFADSLQLPPLAGEWVNWVDLGSGGGFPGMVVAIAAAGGDRVTHLIEADKRKAAFLREVSRETLASTVVHVGRIERILPELSNQVHFDVVSARALAPLDKLLAYARPVLEKGAVGLFLKGKGLAKELTAAAAGGSVNFTFSRSLTDAEAQIVVVRRCDPQMTSV
jgi:16S rRNA (guanine527-N7)-methyltransferase